MGAEMDGPPGPPGAENPQVGPVAAVKRSQGLPGLLLPDRGPDIGRTQAQKPSAGAPATPWSPGSRGCHSVRARDTGSSADTRRTKNKAHSAEAEGCLLQTQPTREELGKHPDPSRLTSRDRS